MSNSPDPSVSLKVYEFKTGVMNMNFLMGAKILKPSSLFNVKIYMGPTASVFVGKNITLNDVKQNSSTTRASANIQVGVGFDISKFSLDVRLEEGLTNIAKDGNGIANNSILFILGYKISGKQ